MSRLVLFFLMLILFSLGGASSADQATALDTVRIMYIKYFSFINGREKDRPEMPFSKGFMEEIKENIEICAEYSYGICGWGSDGDEYLDTQDADPQLNFASSGISFENGAGNIVIVKFNVNPSSKKCGDYCLRKLTFKMKEEAGVWVVDDICYADGVSSRKKLADENDYNKKHPDPYSEFAKRNRKSVPG